MKRRDFLGMAVAVVAAATLPDADEEEGEFWLNSPEELSAIACCDKRDEHYWALVSEGWKPFE